MRYSPVYSHPLPRCSQLQSVKDRIKSLGLAFQTATSSTDFTAIGEESNSPPMMRMEVRVIPEGKYKHFKTHKLMMPSDQEDPGFTLSSPHVSWTPPDAAEASLLMEKLALEQMDQSDYSFRLKSLRLFGIPFERFERTVKGIPEPARKAAATMLVIDLLQRTALSVPASK
eukprot:GHVU01073049.1.p2 GENE.GHVU01073049.1~~GHVU01073049.1.p2  ORF type:complete len:171 (-),score=17.92 GHVU01073049.1:2363-2875(-)